MGRERMKRAGVEINNAPSFLGLAILCMKFWMT